MAVSFSNADVSLTTAATPVLTSGISSPLSITRATITNTDTSSHTVTLYRVFSGGTPSVTNVIVSPNNFPGTIAAGETLALPLTGHNLVNGQAIYGLADVDNLVNISISYVQQS